MRKDKVATADGHTSPIDWREIRKRMEKASEVLEQCAEPSPKERRSILKSRARELAHEPQRGVVAQEFLEVIEFPLASEIYAIESAYVREIYPLKDYTPLPGLPPFILGIVNVRGQILSIIDLKIFFRLPAKGLGQLNKVIIIYNSDMEFGILADDILGSHMIAIDAIQTSLAAGTGIGAEYVRGVTGERVIILNTEKILSDDNLIVHQEAD
jgi:purine-binding chemotaxis protein CheW